jgi:hypothetical protein
MATKNNPAPFDCYENAEPDEPLFTLIARDALAPDVVGYWASLRVAAGKNSWDDPQITEALECAEAMRTWRKVNRD